MQGVVTFFLEPLRAVLAVFGLAEPVETLEVGDGHAVEELLGGIPETRGLLVTIVCLVNVAGGLMERVELARLLGDEVVFFLEGSGEGGFGFLELCQL